MPVNNPTGDFFNPPSNMSQDYEEYNFMFNEPLTSTSPSFSISNSGTYEIQFTTTDACIIPAIDTTHTITVRGIPQIDTLIYEQICNTLSADLTVEFESCFVPLVLAKRLASGSAFTTSAGRAGGPGLKT
mgnify:CR=1 FL=1